MAKTKQMIKTTDFFAYIKLKEIPSDIPHNMSLEQLKILVQDLQKNKMLHLDESKLKEVSRAVNSKFALDALRAIGLLDSEEKEKVDVLETSTYFDVMIAYRFLRSPIVALVGLCVAMVYQAFCFAEIERIFAEQLHHYYNNLLAMAMAFSFEMAGVIVAATFNNSKAILGISKRFLILTIFMFLQILTASIYFEVAPAWLGQYLLAIAGAFAIFVYSNLFIGANTEK